MAGVPNTSEIHTEEAVMDSETETVMPVEGDAMQRFLERTRNDTLFELRRLQHGDRPVTGQAHRERLEAFMSKQLDGRDGGKENVPANRDEVEEHRPEAVVVEVQGLFQQRRVSSVLQSAEFRRHLERIIRGSISSATSNPSPPAPRPRVPSPAPPPAPQLPTGSLGVEGLLPQQASASLGEVIERSRSPSQESVASLAASSSSSSTGPELPAPGLEERPSNARFPTWREISNVHHEQVVQDISELLHQQLVSSTLGGQFRTTLELQMQNHLSMTRTNGAAVANVIRNLPPSGIQRNDFSHLGLNPPVDDADNVSVTSFSATAVPYTHSNLHMSREIQSLKAQLAEMKTMLRLSFDLQMDIQRSIRQEVAAALAQAVGGSQEGRTVSEGLATSRSRPLQDDQCLVCLDRAADCLLYQCGHLCLCFSCGRELQARGSHCPVCRAPIRDVVRAFRSNRD